MAKTIINLSDPVSTLVSKTNTISSHLGDLAQLNVGAANDSDLVQAINFLNTSTKDSATIISIAKSGFQKDSANGIGFDSSAGRFFIPSNTINTAMVEDVAITSTKIENSSITTAKIQNGAITNPKIGNFAVEADNINSDAVTEPKIADDAVGQDQLKSLSTLLIKDVNGSTLKTIHGAGA